MEKKTMTATPCAHSQSLGNSETQIPTHMEGGFAQSDDKWTDPSLTSGKIMG